MGVRTGLTRFFLAAIAASACGGSGSPGGAPTLGKTWTSATTNAAFGARMGHCSLVFNGALWVIGGMATSPSTTFVNDVWTSSDGASWTATTAHAGFTPRYGHGCAVYGGNMWVMGGAQYAGTNYNDVWSSADGITWTQATGSAAFSARYGLSTVTFNGKMWVIAGASAPNTAGSMPTPVNDVWSSTNGVDWTQATAAAAFAARYFQAAAVLNGNMWVVGGSARTSGFQDVYSSADGITWTPATLSAPFGVRSQLGLVAMGTAMYVIGGNSKNDVWTTTNGSDWTELTPAAAFPGRYGHSAVVFGPQLWILAGLYSGGSSADAWHSL